MMNISSFQHALGPLGFDIVHAFPFDALSESCGRTLPALTSNPSCGILVGNTRSGWQSFLLWLQQKADWQALADPFNAFVEHTIQTQCNAFFPEARVLWTHEIESYIVPAQKIAHESGLAFRSAGQFNIHPQFGPWFAIRALILLWNAPIPPKTEAQNPSSDAIEEQASTLFQELYGQLQHASDMEGVQEQWKAWLRLRDVYTVGREYRYTAPQIQYHYTHDREVLEKALEAL